MSVIHIYFTQVILETAVVFASRLAGDDQVILPPMEKTLNILVFVHHLSIRLQARESSREVLDFSELQKEQGLPNVVSRK